MKKIAERNLPYSQQKKNRRQKLPKNSLIIALCKLNPNLTKDEQKKTYDEILDELTCYVERTIQLFWLNYKIGLFTHTMDPNSLVFRLYH